MKKGQSVKRATKRGHLFTKINETLNTIQTYRISKRGYKIMTNEQKLN